MQFLKANTAVDVLIGPFLDSTDGNTTEDALTLSQADIKLSKNGQALTQKTDATAAAFDDDGYYNCELDATDTGTEGTLVLIVHESGALAVRHEFMVLSEAAYDSLFVAKDTGFMDVNVKAISEDETAANNLETACDGGSYNVGGGSVVAASVTGAAGSVTGAVGSVTAGVTLAAGAVTDASLAGNMEIVFETDFATNYNVTRNAWVTNFTDVLGTYNAQTGDSFARIGANGAGLTDLATAASIAALNDISAADVNAQCDAAIETYHLDHLLAADYDPASKPGVATALLNELVESDAGVSRYTVNALENAPSGTGASAATIADAVWDEAQADHVSAGTFGVTASEIATIEGKMPTNYVMGSSDQADHDSDFGAVTLANVAHGGAAATLALATITVDNSGGSGDAVAVTAGTNGVGASFVGDGSGHGISILSGSGIGAHGVSIASLGALNAHGIKVTSAAGVGFVAETTHASFPAVRFQSIGTVSGAALKLIGGASGGTGLEVSGGSTTGDAIDLSVTSGSLVDYGGSGTELTDAVVDAMEVQMNADPTGFKVNVLEVGGTSQTANDNGADINAILVDTAAIAGLENISAADVNAQVADVMKTDPVSENAQGAPPTTPTMEEAIMYIYMALVHGVDVSATSKDFKNNAGTVIWKKALSADDITYTEAESESGP